MDLRGSADQAYGSQVAWYFQCDMDISFSVSVGKEKIKPPSRCQTNRGLYTTKPGAVCSVVFEWDNGFSWFNSKDIHYEITLKSPEEVEKIIKEDALRGGAKQHREGDNNNDNKNDNNNDDNDNNSTENNASTDNNNNNNNNENNDNNDNKDNDKKASVMEAAETKIEQEERESTGKSGGSEASTPQTAPAAPAEPSPELTAAVNQLQDAFTLKKQAWNVARANVS